MLIKVNGVGDPKIKYKDHKNIKFDSLDSYLLLARKSISKFANSMFQGLAKKMLNDEDAVASIANAIMMADWRWDENYSSNNGTKKTKYSYRNQCALWAIQTYVSKMYKTPKNIKKIYSLDHSTEDLDGLSVHESLQDNKSAAPDDILINNETQENLSNLVNSLLNLNCISDRQKDYIKLYYFENYTFDKIGKKYGITREAVRQGLNKALNILKDLINDK